MQNLLAKNFCSCIGKHFPHPLYSPNLVPTDYHLFQALQNFLNGKIFATDDEVKTADSNFFNSMPAEFCNKVIHDLLCHRKQIIDNNCDDPDVWYMPFTALYHCIFAVNKICAGTFQPNTFSFFEQFASLWINRNDDIKQKKRNG